MGKWEMVRLGDVCVKITDGSHNPPKGIENSPYLMLSSKNIFDDEITLVDPRYLTFSDFNKEHKRTNVKEGTILMTIVGTVGRVAIVNNVLENIALQRSVAALHVDDSILYNRFCMYSLISSRDELIKTSHGVAQKGIYLKQLAEITIPLPPLKIQQKIAATLDTAAALLKLRKQQLAELEALIQSVFYEMFGDLAINKMNWEKSVLVEFCENNSDIRCGPFGTQLSKDEYKTEGVALWGIPQINTKFKINPTDFLSEKKAKQLEAYSIITGDIVMSRKGNVGKCAIYPDNFSSGIMHSDALRIRVDSNKISSIFLMHQLHHSRYVLNQIESVSSGAVMAGVNVTKLKRICVHNPPIELQTQFAAIVQKIEEQKALVQQSIDETQTLFDCLMSQYFE